MEELREELKKVSTWGALGASGPTAAEEEEAALEARAQAAAIGEALASADRLHGKMTKGFLRGSVDGLPPLPSAAASEGGAARLVQVLHDCESALADEVAEVAAARPAIRAEGRAAALGRLAVQQEQQLVSLRTQVILYIYTQ